MILKGAVYLHSPKLIKTIATSYAFVAVAKCRRYGKIWPMQRKRKRPFLDHSHLLLILFILLAFGLRLHNIEAFSFWTDEGLTPLRASYPLSEIFSNRITIQEAISKDTHPPFYFLLIHVSRQLWGETDFAYRFPSVLAGILLVPLLFQFGRRWHSRRLGWLLALLTAVNPLQIWYANEARMYTLLVLLGAVASYLLLRALTGGNLQRNLIIYLIVAGLAVYTHYTAVILIGVQSLFWIWLLWHNGQRRLIVGMAILLILVSIPLIPFTIPRLFTGAEANYKYVSPQVMLQDVVHFFGMGMTTDFSQTIIKLLDLIVLGLLLLGLYAARTWKDRAFFLVYLLATVFGLMLGSYLFKPMYQGVRHIMIGSPAFLILLAWSILFLWERSTADGGRRWRWQSLAAFVLFLSLLGPLMSLNNLYNDDEYAKGDFRAQIQRMEQYAGANDVIVYNDAIILPMHEHYRTRPDIALTALPIYPRKAVADDPNLKMLAQTYDRIWFVPGAPADDRDEEGLVREWLKANLTQVATLSTLGKEGVVSVYATAPTVVAGLPTDAPELDIDPLAIQWSSIPSLLGIQINFAQPATLPNLWLDLFWQSGTLPDPNTDLRFSLRDPKGVAWLQKNFRLSQGDKSVWLADGLVRRTYDLPVVPGTPPGNYQLLVQPFVSGAPVGGEQRVAEIELAPSSSWPAVTAPIPERTTPILFDNGLILQAIEMFDVIVRPGHTLPINLYWLAEGEAIGLLDVHYQLEVVADDGQPLRTQNGMPGPDWLGIWPLDSVILSRTGLYFPPETEPGRYQLRWQLFAGEARLPGRPSWRPWFSESIIMGEVEVTPWPLITDLPDDMTPILAAFGSIVHLSGYELRHSVEEAALHLNLAWQVQAQPDDNYALFIHLIEPESGMIAAQADVVPGNGLRPSQGWRATEVITDTIVLPVPPDLPLAGYQINIGFYNPDDGARLPVLYQDEPQPHDQLTLLTWP